MTFQNLYENHYKKLLIIPLVIAILSFAFLINKQITTGSFIERDFSLKGGVSATITTNQEINLDSFEQFLKDKFPNVDISFRTLSDLGTGSNKGLIIEATDISKDNLLPIIQEQFPNSRWLVRD